MIKLFLSIFLACTFPLSSFGNVEVCHRRAQILNGLVDHYWIKTSIKNAGMGSGSINVDQIGDKFEAPYSTEVFVVDHSDQSPDLCVDVNYVNEECVNNELEIGKPLGYFNMLNNCQSFVAKVINRCLILDLYARHLNHQ